MTNSRRKSILQRRVPWLELEATVTKEPVVLELHVPYSA